MNHIRSFEGASPSLGAQVYVDASAVIIGDVKIGADSSVWPLCSVRGDVMGIEIGERTNIQDGSVLHTTSDSEFTVGGRRLIIGDDATIGHACIVHACTLKSLCLIGMGTTLLDGCVVETEAMIGAHSLVPPNKLVEGGYLWLGRPVERIRKLKAKELEFLRYSAANYCELKDRYLKG